MAGSYYYLGASLPMLNFQGKLPMSVQGFLADCERLMSRDDYETVSGLLNNTGGNTTNPVIAMVEEFERGLSNHIAVYRAQKFNKDAQSFIRGQYNEQPALTELVKQAANAGDPLEGDKLISKARWQFYDELMASQFYNLAFVLLYGLKLKIVERYHNIASPKGREIYEELKKIEFPQGFAFKG